MSNHPVPTYHAQGPGGAGRYPSMHCSRGRQVSTQFNSQVFDQGFVCDVISKIVILFLVIKYFVISDFIYHFAESIGYLCLLWQGKNP